MAELTIQQLNDTGKEITYAAVAASGDHVFLNNARGYMARIAATSTAVVCTIPGVRKDTQTGLAIDKVISVGTTEEKTVRLLEGQRDKDTGRMDFTYDVDTGVTIAIVEG